MPAKRKAAEDELKRPTARTATAPAPLVPEVDEPLLPEDVPPPPPKLIRDWVQQLRCYHGLPAATKAIPETTHFQAVCSCEVDGKADEETGSCNFWWDTRDGPLYQRDCTCNAPAKQKTSRKETSKGERFWACAEVLSERGCGYFVWENPEMQAKTDSNAQRNKPKLSTTLSCFCDKYAILRRVRREGPNKRVGREYATCNEPGKQKCRFWKWTEE